MVDVSILISLGNLLARRTTWLVLKTTSTLQFSPTVLDSFPWQGFFFINTLIFQHSLSFSQFHLESQHSSLSQFHLQCQHTLSSVTSRENTLTLSISTEPTHSSSFYIWLPTQKCILHATILFFNILCRWNFFQPRIQKFR